MSDPIRILRRPEVEARTGFKRSQLYKLMAEGSFPRPVKLSVRAIGWREADVESWLRSREAA